MTIYIFIFTIIIEGLIAAYFDFKIHRKDISWFIYFIKASFYSLLIFELFLLTNYLRGWNNVSILTYFENPSIQLLLKMSLINTFFSIVLPHIVVLVEFVYDYLLVKLYVKR